MNKEELKKLQAELNSISEKKFSKLSDKKLSQLNDIVSKGGKSAYSLPNVRKKFIESGKKQGKKNAESGFLNKIRTIDNCKLGGKIGFDKQCVELICPKCGVKGTGRVMYKWHFDNCNNKKILQYDLNNHLIKVWDSYIQLNNDGFHTGHISDCCKGKKKSYRSYIWKYEN